MSNILRPPDQKDGSVKSYIMRNISKEGVSFNKERQERLFRPYNFDGTELSPFKAKKEGFHRELNEVDVEAERYIEEAKGKAKEMEDEAYKKGFSDGKKEGIEIGRKEASERIEPVLDSFKKGVEELSIYRREIYERSEGEVLELVLSVAKRVIHKEISLSRDVILSVIRAAMKSVLSQDKITLRVNPGDLEIAMASKPDLKGLVDDINNISIKGDESISRGGCIIETDHRTIDARIEQQIKEIEEILRNNVSSYRL